MKHSTSLDPLAENAVIAVCALADAAGPGRWSSGAVEDAATALEVLAGALSNLSPEAAELLEVIPAAVAALRERVEHAPAGAVPAHRADAAADPAVLSTGLRRALTAHSLTGHRVHQLGPALLTVTLDAAHAQALAVLLAARRALPPSHPPSRTNPAGARGRPRRPRPRSRWPWPPTGRGHTPVAWPPDRSPPASPRRRPRR
ncbi:hypothetical protein [Streptomyces sp. NPDC092307]|uniref:hypothetical protein n=1 Tax=Streptomyces sp. NPDC092307 TaxID=3366013 RepID=UPI003806C8BC